MTDLEDLPMLYAELYPTGTWSEPCDVRCRCGFNERAATCTAAQELAADHDHTHHLADAVRAWEAFATNGVLVSVCCGPMGPSGRVAWSVTALDPARGQEFPKPYAATSFVHAMSVARRELKRRRWLRPA